MGTSSSHSGNKDNKGLLPSDYNGQQSKPEVSWQATKTGFSKYINGHGGGVAKTARNYVKAAGGTAGLIKSSKSGIRGAVNIGRLFSDIQQQGYQKAFDDLGIEYQGKSAKEICSSLVNYISASADSKEDSVARIAAVNAMSKMYEYMENNNLELQSLDKVDNVLMEQVLSTYVECYIWGRILNDLQYCLEKYSDDIDRTMKVEQEMKDYVSSKVRTTFQIKEIRDKIFGHHSIEDGIEALYEKCYNQLIHLIFADYIGQKQYEISNIKKKGRILRNQVSWIYNSNCEVHLLQEIIDEMYFQLDEQNIRSILNFHIDLIRLNLIRAELAGYE